MKFLDDIGKGFQSVGKTVASPFVAVGHGVGSVVTTLHDDVKGIFKGTYNIASGLSSDLGTSFTQLTSPVGIISVAVVIGVLIIATRSGK